MEAEENERQRKFVEDTMEMMRKFEQEHPSIEMSCNFSQKHLFTLEKPEHAYDSIEREKAP